MFKAMMRKRSPMCCLWRFRRRSLYDRDPKLGRDVPYISYKGKRTTSIVPG